MKNVIVITVLVLASVGTAAAHVVHRESTVPPGTVVTFGPQRSGENPWSCKAMGVNSAGWVETSCIDGDGLPVVRLFTKGNYNRVQILACPPPKLQTQEGCTYHSNYYGRRYDRTNKATVFTFTGP